ncbi:conserved Plasmodium protein, unknown function [Plasmodium ovale curtisi]|uniref:Rab3-GAP regulatory subunit N-terminal domain-containing protein n=1 Tax=Plasmodium ovale curtisi TaxID=864141 RepID=A0A1A8VQZ5_PLAOA|nr:conserved Plasmodium protein, unknown function [Plasmodium ovale curtisi]
MKETYVEKNIYGDDAEDGENGSDMHYKRDGKKTKRATEMVELEEVFTLEILIKILSKIFMKGNYCITKDDINTKNCKVFIYESKFDLPNLKQVDEEFINMLFYFQNKNYLFFLIYCLNKKNIVYLNFFNPLLNEKESIESLNLFFMNNFFPHIILGLNNGKIFLYNHEGILCMQNKFIDNKIKNITIEHQRDYILFVHENNTIVNSNIHLIKRALDKNAKTIPFDYVFSINKNMSINHIILRYDNTPDVLKKDIYSVYNKDDLMRYINDNLHTNMFHNIHNGNINYIVTSKNITLSVLHLVKQNSHNDFLSKKESFSTSEKLSSKINNFIKNIFTKRNDSSAALGAASSAASSAASGAGSSSASPTSSSASLATLGTASASPAGAIYSLEGITPSMISPNSSSGSMDIHNTSIVYSFNDPKRQIIDICICPWNNNLILALDNLGRICLFNISTLTILYMWKSYRSAFMSFIQKKKARCYNDNNSESDKCCNGNNQGKHSTIVTASQFDKGIFFYLKTRNLIEIWDIKTLHKIFCVRTYEDPAIFKIFFMDHDVPNKIYFFNTDHHVFLMNPNFELFHIKWV